MNRIDSQRFLKLNDQLIDTTVSHLKFIFKKILNFLWYLKGY